MSDIQATFQIALPLDAIAAFCARWQITEFALFGSVLRPDFSPASDVDVLVSFAPGTKQGLFDQAEMESELRELFGREVDLVYRRVIERSDNYLLRRAILGSARVIYGT